MLLVFAAKCVPETVYSANMVFADFRHHGPADCSRGRGWREALADNELLSGPATEELRIKLGPKTNLILILPRIYAMHH